MRMIMQLDSVEDEETENMLKKRKMKIVGNMSR